MLNGFGAGDRGERFYEACLEYSHSLWQRGLAARAILCLDRAMGADLRGGEPSLERWPMPYAAMVWFLRHTPEGTFIGNPRVHFQHYADRMNEPRKEVRTWRAWACWALACRTLPDLPGDPRHRVREPDLGEIASGLGLHGLSGESLVWTAEIDRLGG
jgi:hypothetical protein